MHTPASLLPFILLTEKLKSSNRATTVVGTDRKENSAEHSWQVALLALVFADFSNEEVDLLKVLKMLLIHDLPEALCGDVPLYAANRHEAAKKEESAAKEVFSMLSDSMNEEFQNLWNEFNARETPEAKFCACIDRIMGFVQNLHTGGGTWAEFKVNREMIIEKSGHAKEGSDEIWEFLLGLVDEGVERGFLRDS